MKDNKFSFYFPCPFAKYLRSEYQYDFFEKKIAKAQKMTLGQSDFFYEKDCYDSSFYGFPVFKILYCRLAASQSLRNFVQYMRFMHQKCYVYAEIPSEDLRTLAAFSEAGGKLIETRLYFYSENFCAPAENPFAVRRANHSDISLLRKIAKENPNEYDRHHAESLFFGKADLYLAEYAQKAVEGFCDMVLVPEMANFDAFMAVNCGFDTKTGVKTLRPVVSAVGAANRGWHYHLLLNALCIGQNEGAEFAYMNTQSTNRAVLRNFEKLSLRYGCTKHLFSFV